MVLPGWNVSEPLQVAVRLCKFVQAYRDAPTQIQEFASQVSAFNAALKALERCLKNRATIPLDDLTIPKDTSGGLRHCAEKCDDFVNGFFKDNAPLRDEIGAGGRLNWIWKDNDAAALKQAMNTWVGIINFHFGVANL